MKLPRESPAAKLAALAALCLAAYGPSLRIPLMEDDYPLLWEAQKYGAPSALGVLLHFSASRLRATSYWSMWQLWRLFHANAWPYHVFSLLLHVGCVWAAFAVARMWPRMRPAAFWAAAFFAVAEGHQEAVMWFSSINELYVFLFGAASLALWLAAARPGAKWGWNAASAALFALALLSKEPAFAWLPLFLLADLDRWKRALARLIPHAALALLALASVEATRGNSFRFADGSFSLAAPFWFTGPYNIVRVLGVCGALSLAALFWRRAAGTARSAALAVAWIGVALVPYSFLTYSRQIPSRQTYVASFGLALLFGLAVSELWRIGEGRWRRWAVVAAALVLLGNAAVLWTKKRAQFEARAQPTEELIQLARQTGGPIWVRCFPRTPYIAEQAVHMAAGLPPSTLIWSEAEARRRKPAAEFCYPDH
ncbi:MAG TPA: hypothetical protein VMU19_15440 [Bryobacteraceae bacterium]|nr:hypothetical protein [Bryobacteraceae bacterium]